MVNLGLGPVRDRCKESRVDVLCKLPAEGLRQATIVVDGLGLMAVWHGTSLPGKESGTV